MGDKGEKNRKRILEAANRLFYHHGYNRTSFTEIVQAAGVPRGNIYYYFKTKDEILGAVIERRMGDIRAMLREWDQTYARPADRLRRFVQILPNSELELIHYGCPMGSLNTELGKGQLNLREQARLMFDLLRDYLRTQFAALGFNDSADELGLHLLARGQGISVIAHVYEDREFLHREVESLKAWIESVAESGSRD